MANDYHTTPAQKPPQTSGQKASAGLADSGGKINAYLKARGAKPVSGLGVSSSGGMAKQRRMQGVSQPNQAAGRRRGPKSSAAFAGMNGVPTGGRRIPPGKPPISAGGVPRHHPGPDPGVINPRRGAPSQGGNANPAGVRGALDRARDFMNARRPPQGGAAGIGALSSRFGGNTGQGGGARPGLVQSAQNAMNEIQGKGQKPAMPPTTQPKPGPVTSAQATMPTKPVPMPPTGGGTGGGGGGNVTGPGRQANRAKVV